MISIAFALFYVPFTVAFICNKTLTPKYRQDQLIPQFETITTGKSNAASDSGAVVVLTIDVINDASRTALFPSLNELMKDTRKLVELAGDKFRNISWFPTEKRLTLKIAKIKNQNTPFRSYDPNDLDLTNALENVSRLREIQADKASITVLLVGPRKGKKVQNEMNGIAYVSSLCNEESSAVVVRTSSRDENNSDVADALVLAHEIGHIIGMDHDEGACPTEGFIMQQTMCSNCDGIEKTVFSECSVKKARDYLENNRCWMSGASTAFTLKTTSEKTNNTIRQQQNSTLDQEIAPAPYTAGEMFAMVAVGIAAFVLIIVVASVAIRRYLSKA